MLTITAQSNISRKNMLIMKPEFLLFFQAFFEPFFIHLNCENKFPLEYTLKPEVESGFGTYTGDFHVFLSFSTDYKKCHLFCTNEPRAYGDEALQVIAEECETNNLTAEWVLEKIRAVTCNAGQQIKRVKGRVTKGTVLN